MSFYPYGTYVRLGGPRVLSYSSRSEPGRLTFIDVKDERRLDQLLEWPGAYRSLSPLNPVVARFDGDIEDLSSVSDRLRVSAPVGILRQVPGHSADIEWSREFKESEEEPDFSQLRALELVALLTWGHGIWEPSNYHFRLPSGHHTGTFIRVANALIDPRAADVLARWFDPHLTDGCGMIVDSGRLTGLVLALLNRMRSAGFEPGEVALLEDYPTNSFDLQNLVDKVNQSSSQVVGVVSVSSSGSLIGMLSSIMYTTVSESDRTLVVMVDRQERERADLDTWLHYSDPAKGEWAPATGCHLCQSPERSYLINVDPRTFDGMLPHQIRLQRPSILAQARNKDFWEVAKDFVGVEELPDPQMIENRPRATRMAVRIRWPQLLKSPDFGHQVLRRLPHLKKVNEALLKGEPYPEFESSADLILCPSHEAAMPGHVDLIEGIANELGLGSPLIREFPVKRTTVWPELLRDQIQEAKSILLLSHGLVTGRTLHRAKRAIQEAKKLHSIPEYIVQGLVIHARPDNKRDWRDLWNVFDRRLYALWLSYIPDSQSPLRDEAEVLEAFNQSHDLGELSVHAQAFLETRIAICQGQDSSPASVFWGFPSDAQTTPYALPGQLDALGAYAATGSAIHEARLVDPPQLPERAVFDMASIARSYFDEVLLAGYLRWIRPHELSWMVGRESAQETLQHLLNRTSDPHNRAALLGELLLAAALGKIPKVDRPYLLAEARTMLSQSEETAAWRGALELGVVLIDSENGDAR